MQHSRPFYLQASNYHATTQVLSDALVEVTAFETQLVNQIDDQRKTIHELTGKVCPINCKILIENVCSKLLILLYRFIWERKWLLHWKARRKLVKMSTRSLLLHVIHCDRRNDCSGSLTWSVFLSDINEQKQIGNCNLVTLFQFPGHRQHASCPCNTGAQWEGMGQKAEGFAWYASSRKTQGKNSNTMLISKWYAHVNDYITFSCIWCRSSSWKVRFTH